MICKTIQIAYLCIRLPLVVLALLKSLTEFGGFIGVRIQAVKFWLQSTPKAAK